MCNNVVISPTILLSKEANKTLGLLQILSLNFRKPFLNYFAFLMFGKIYFMFAKSLFSQVICILRAFFRYFNMLMLTTIFEFLESR